MIQPKSMGSMSKLDKDLNNIQEGQSSSSFHISSLIKKQKIFQMYQVKKILQNDQYVMRVLITHKSLHIERSLRIIQKAYYVGQDPADNADEEVAHLKKEKQQTMKEQEEKEILDNI